MAKKKSDSAPTPEENECPDVEPVETPEADKSAEEQESSHPVVGTELAVDSITLEAKYTGIKPSEKLECQMSLAKGSHSESFFKALVENDTHGWLQAQGVDVKAIDTKSVSPDQIKAVAKVLCSILMPICAAVEAL